MAPEQVAQARLDWVKNPFDGGPLSMSGTELQQLVNESTSVAFSHQRSLPDGDDPKGSSPGDHRPITPRGNFLVFSLPWGPRS